MAPTILVAGATGNTGQGVVETLSELLQTSTAFSGHRILALTRSLNSTVAQSLAKLPNVEVAEQSWVEITADWLREKNIVRAFIASHAQTNQFAEESSFHLAALNAGVDYVVRVSTTAPNVRPDSPAYYPRAHWAIETMLSSPEFEGLKWTSLQPNIFSTMYLYSSVAFVNHFRKTGEQGPLLIAGAEDAPVGIIHPYEIGAFAAHLLTQQDVSPHKKAKYVLNGPEDITGRQTVELVEKYIGVKVEDVRFKDVSFIDAAVDAQGSGESKNVLRSAKYGAQALWEGKCTASTTSKEVLELAPMKRTPTEVFKTMLGE